MPEWRIIVDTDLDNQLTKQADSEHRSKANLIKLAVIKYLENVEDEDE